MTWQRLLAAVIACNGITIAAALYVGWRQTDIFDHAVADNREWASRLAQFTDLQRLAAAINAPGNDVFDSGDPWLEAGRLNYAYQHFNERLAAVKADINSVTDASVIPILAHGLDKVEKAVESMTTEARAVMSLVARDNREEAARRMAVMDRKLADTNREFAALATKVRQIQTATFDAQAAAVASVRLSELLVAALVLIALAALAGSGRAIAARIRRTEEERSILHGRVWKQAEALEVAVTEAKQALKEKNEQAEELERALAQIETQRRVLDRHAIVSETDLKGRITYANDEFCRISGYVREELIGKDHRVLNSGLQPPGFWREMYRILAGGHVWQSEVCNKAKDGAFYWVTATNVAKIDPQGKPLGYISVRTDITAVKAREAVLEIARHELVEAKAAAEAANKAKSEFLATMSHEIRTPMNGVLGMLGLLLDTPLSPEQKRYARTARESADSLLVLIDDILDYSKLEARRIDLERATFSVSQVVDGVISLLGSPADEKRLELSQDIAPNLPAWVVGDPTRLRQILLNLVGNAIKFTSMGSVRVKARHRDLPDGTVEVRFEVSDTGIGIAEEARAKLFTRFAQADSSTTRKYGGTGLGLAICKQLAELMGGEIGVDSEPGQGSCFWFTIRCAIGDCAIETLIIDAEGRAARDLGRLRILVAEDNAVNQLFVTTLLGKMGHSVDVVETGAQAVAAVTRAPYDLVLMDVQMPEMDGPTATSLIRRLDGPAAGIPIIALTANAMSGHREQYLAAGMDDYVTKPINRDLLVGAIARAVEMRRLGLPAGGDKPPAQSDMVPAQTDMAPRDAPHPDAGADHAALLPLFDEARLAELGECFEPSELGMLMANIAAEGSQCLRAIEAAANGGDLEGAKRVAHKLKGMTANLGALRLSDVARRIEIEAEAAAHVLDLVADLRSALGATEGAARTLELHPTRARQSHP